MAREWRELQRPLRISTYGFWGGWIPQISTIVGLFNSQVEVELVSYREADMLLTSIFGGKPDLFRDNFVMQYSGESSKNWPRWGDYYLGFLPDDSSHFYLPHWMHDILSFNPNTKVLTFNDKFRPAVAKDQFCAIFASHGGNGQRGRIFDELNGYKPVHSYGGWNNNMPGDGARGDELNRSNKKMSVLDHYKYSLAIENCSEAWYLTEKLPESLLSNTIPIYWGCPNVGDSPFNLKRVIDATNLGPGGILEKVISIDNDPETYAKMLAEPMFNRVVFPDGLAARSEILLKRILEEKS